MHEEGAGFVAQGVAMTALIDEITGKQIFDGTKQRRKKVLKGKDSRIRRASK
jgi:hypothetical protein